MTRLSASLFVLSASHPVPVPCLCAPKHKKTPRRCSPTKKVEFLPSCLLCFEAGSLLPKVHFTQAHAANPLNPKQNAGVCPAIEFLMVFKAKILKIFMYIKDIN